MSIQFKVIDQLDEDDIFDKTAGMLKDKKIDPLKFQDDQRGNAGWPDALAVFRKNDVIDCLHGSGKFVRHERVFLRKRKLLIQASNRLPPTQKLPGSTQAFPAFHPESFYLVP